MKRKYLYKNRQGSALVFVIIMFIVIIILATSMANLFSNNLRQTKYQQDALEAYYLAYSAGLIAYEALLYNNNEKLDELISNNSQLTVNSKPMGSGKVTVVAEKTTDTNFEGWIKVTSTAVLDRNNHTSTRSLYFDPANPLDILWTSN